MITKVCTFPVLANFCLWKVNGYILLQEGRPVALSERKELRLNRKKVSHLCYLKITLIKLYYSSRTDTLSTSPFFILFPKETKKKKVLST